MSLEDSKAGKVTSSPKGQNHDTTSKNFATLILICETLLILIAFNASSYFATTTYAKSIAKVGVFLVILLLFWIWINSQFFFSYNAEDLGLTTKTVSSKQWKAIFIFIFFFYLVALTIEFFFPTEIKGEVTLTRLLITAIFTLTFGPVFEELLFRGYLFKRSQETFHSETLNLHGFQISVASIFTGISFGLWHLPTPIILIYFNENIFKVYSKLWTTILGASITGIFLGEIRFRTKSILPGCIIHFCANSPFIIAMILKLL